MNKIQIDKQAVAKLFDECKMHELEFIDFRFTDIKGVWHHLSFSANSIN